MKKTAKLMAIFMTSVLILGGCNSDSSSTKPLPNSIEVNESGLYPEGISYNHNTQRFYLSSYHKGKIVSVDHEGTIYPFAEDSSLLTIVGMKIDPKNNRLIACNTDLGFSTNSTTDENSTIGRLAKVEVYDLGTQKKISTYDLSNLYQGGHFINDLTLDTAGNIYVTDSFSPVIYKIATDGTRSVFAESSLFSVEANQFGLNGIVATETHLIVAKSEGAKLFKIAFNDPSDIHEITVNQNLNSIDGLLLNSQNELLVVSNNFIGEGFNEAVYKLQSLDDWNTGTVKGTFTVEGKVYPTTLTDVDGTVYVNYSYLPSLIQNKPNIDSFKIQKVTF